MAKICLGCMTHYDEEYSICPICGYVEGTHVADTMHMEPGSRLQDRYIVGKALGNGGFGVTYIGRDTLIERNVAIKEYLPSEFSTRTPGQTKITVFTGDKSEQFADGLSRFVEEAQRLAKFANMDGIVNIFDSFEENNTAYIVMELLQGETLAERLKRDGKIPVDETLTMMMPVIQSLEAVHKKGIIHRDIAPDNIFLTDSGNVKLIDFGAARFATTTHSRSLTVIIKQGYSPEEQYRSRGDQGPYTDVYAIGATLYKMITGQAPPDALERRALLERKKKDVLAPPSKYCKLDINVETAILNALNIRIEDRTPDMSAFLNELTTDKSVKRRHGKIKKTDLLHWPLWAKIGVPSAMLIVAVLITLFATGVIGFESSLARGINIPEGMSRVPSVVNDNLDNADRRLNEVELSYSITGKEYSSDIEVNYVLKQDISGGSIVEINTVINIVVSGGAETQTMPSVEGLPVDAAKKALEELGFVVQTEEKYSPVEKGAVISQNVQFGTEYAVGGTVTLLVSAGTDPSIITEIKPITAPRLVDMTYEAALIEAEALGIILSVNRTYSDTVEKDNVISQSVAAGSEMMSGSVIEITVSLGNEIVIVRDVQYRPEAEARAVLEGQGLNVNVLYSTSETIAEGLVISQSPAAQTSVSPNYTVSLVVSRGGKSSVTPNVVVDGQDLISISNVVGKSQSEASRTLTSQGFVVSTSEAFSDTVAKGDVISQTPAAGTSQMKNTTVVITVSRGREQILVPSVVGSTQSTAELNMKNLGFIVRTNEEHSDTVAKGSVISQSPSAGEYRIKGDIVTLTISLGKASNPPINVFLNPEQLTLAEGGTAQIIATIDPDDADDKTIKWASDNERVASVNSSGFVTAKSSGTANITATTNTGNVTRSCHVTVTKPELTAAALEPSNITLSAKETVLISVILEPTNAISKSVSWVSSDPSVATVNTNGAVTANSAGTAVITATIESYGNVTFARTCIVTVNPAALSSIRVTTMPTKTSYITGESINLNGTVVTATYSDGSSKVITGTGVVQYQVNEPLLEGTNTVTVSYTEGDIKKTTTFNITASKPTLSSILVTTMPTKTFYSIDENLNTGGMVVTATYSNGSTKNVTSSCTISGFDSISAGTKTITMSYTENGVTVTTTFTVTVNPTTVTPSVSITSGTRITAKVGDTIYVTVNYKVPERMILWFGYYVPGTSLWIDEQSYFVDAGTASYTYAVDTNRFNFSEQPSGTYSIGVALFYPDKFGQGQSGYSDFCYITLTVD